jgi:ligand-binding sensor domain-containing protein/signal transduction histidine kinase
VLGILSLAIALQLPGYTVDRWTAADGLPASATSILRTADGYLWFGSFTGLVRFDGVRAVRIPGLPNEEVLALRQDRSGDIWIGTNGGGLIRMRGTEFQSWTTKEGLTHDSVFAIGVDDAGGIWAATPGGLNLLKDGRLRTFREPDLPDDFVQWIQPGPTGRLWITTRSGVCEIRGETPVCGAVTMPPNTMLNSAIEARDGAFWMGTTGAGFKRVQGATLTSFAGRSGHVWSLMESRNGDIWIGHGRVGGVSVVRGDQVLLTLTEHDGLPTNTVRAMYEDPEGSIWIATDGGGVVRLRPKRVTTYTRADGLPHDVSKAIAQTTDGSIWAGFNCGPVSRWNGERFEPVFEREIGSYCTFALTAARDGSLWIGSWGNGLFRWQLGRLTRFSTADGLASNIVPLLFEDSKGGIWAGSDDRDLSYISRDGTITRYSAKSGIGAPRVTSLAETPDGRIWIISGNTLSTLEQGRFQPVGADAGLPSAVTGPLFVDRADRLWVSTARGLFRRSGDRFVSFAAAHPALAAATAMMLDDQSGDFWIGTTNSSLIRFLASELDAFAAAGTPVTDTIVLDRRDGLLAGPHGTSAHRARDGRLWFPTIRGILVVDPAAIERNVVPPPVAIENTPGGSVRIAPGTSAFEFHYTGLSHLDPAKVAFRYQLEGFDETWVDAGTRRTAYYTRMTPGEYRFRVIAANNDGVWSAPVAVQVLVEPFLWETRWFQGLALLLIIAATVLSTRAVLVRRTKRRFEALERERALDHERTRIARDLHDDLGSRLTKIALIADRGGAALGAEARSAIQAIDELVWTVNARNDTLDGFVSYALAYAQEQLQAADLRLRVDTPAIIPRRPMNADVRRQLFMAYKEALNNVVKHSHATEVRVACRIEDDAIELAIHDNGRGFDPAAGNPSGNGLPGMSDRLAAIGGRTEIRSAPGGGTAVQFRLVIAPA